jgi:hypothetical protein
MLCREAFIEGKGADHRDVTVFKSRAVVYVEAERFCRSFSGR